MASIDTPFSDSIPFKKKNMQVLDLKEDFMYTMDIFLHDRDRFLYYREDDMPDMVRIDTSRLKYEVTKKIK
jgi:hypothetical protein